MKNITRPFFFWSSPSSVSIQAEVKTSEGRADVVIETEDAVYIFEFKLYDSKEDALQQIKDMQYAKKYQGENRTIHLVGVEFRGRNIGDWVVETI